MDNKQFQYKSGQKAVNCPGCGGFGVIAALNNALVQLGIEKNKIAIVTGIGCSSTIVGQSTYGMHTLHGRLIPIASGVKLANPDLTVIGAGGDGDGYGIGVGHLIHAARRNLDITYIVMDNQIYGLTTGQASPTTLMGEKTKTTPFGVIESPINPIALALSSGATFVARGFTGDPAHLTNLIKNGISHKGFSIIDILSPCLTFNKTNNFDWFRQRVYKLEEQGHDASDFQKAMVKAKEMDLDLSKIPIGLFYQVKKPTYEELDVTDKASNITKMQPPTKEAILKILESYK